MTPSNHRKFSELRTESVTTRAIRLPSAQWRPLEQLAGYWPYQVWEDAPNGGIPKLFKEIKKYVVSRSGGVDTSWQGSVLLRDVADVKRLRDDDGPTLLT